MKHETQVELSRHLLGYIADRTTFLSSDDERVAVTAFSDRDRFETEQELVLRTHPAVVGFGSQMAAPGDYTAATVAGVPVVVVRDDNGTLKAFINACRHRGTELVEEGVGSVTRAFTCPYHRWRYGLDGALVGIPDAAGFPDIQPEQVALAPLPVAEKFGLVWVVPTPAAPLDLDTYLGADMVDELNHYGFDAYHHFRSTTVDVHANWKLMYDTFLEFYHGAYLHPDTLAHLMAKNIVHFDRLGDHYRMVAAKKSIKELSDLPEQDWRLLDHAVVSYDIFPNLAVNHHGDHVAVYRVIPDGDRVDGSKWEFSMLTPEPVETDKAKAYFDQNFDYIVRTGTEDVAAAESMQRTLASGANKSMLYGRFEPGNAWFHRRLAATLAEPS